MNDSRRIKVLIVHSDTTGGGATRIAIDDALALRRRGFEVAFASEGGQLEDEVRTAGIALHRLFLVDPLRYPRSLRYFVGIPVTTMILLALVLRYRFDRLYVQHRQHGVAALAVQALTGAAYVFHAQGEFGAGHRGRWLTPLGRHVIACSERVKENIIKYYRVPARGVTVIPNASDTNVVKATEESLRAFDKQWNISPGAPVVACVAMLVEVKAHDVLLTAWRKVLDSFPAAMLVMTGTGPVRGRLEALSAQLRIQHAVRFLGFVDDVGLVYSRADFGVLASRSEGLPKGIMDGFPYGVPAVATAVSGIPEMVVPGKTGLLVDPDNPEQLAQAIIRLLSDRELCRQLGQNARQFVIENYSSAVRQTALTNYFRELVQSV